MGHRLAAPTGSAPGACSCSAVTAPAGAAGGGAAAGALFTVVVIGSEPSFQMRFLCIGQSV